MIFEVSKDYLFQNIQYNLLFLGLLLYSGFCMGGFFTSVYIRIDILMLTDNVLTNFYVA
jgi:hypothetical protein